MSDQSEDAAVVAVVTQAMREADRKFETVGGSTRHHVRGCLLPALGAKGWSVLPDQQAIALEARVAELEEALRDACMYGEWDGPDACWNADPCCSRGESSERCIRNRALLSVKAGA